LGLKNWSPLDPEMTLMVTVLEPLTNVPAGMLHSYMSPQPRYAPRVTPRLSIVVGAAGAEHVYEFTVACGRPPAKESVVAMRSVAVDNIALDKEKLIFCPLFTPLNIAMGQDEVAVLETVPGDHWDILCSVGGNLLVNQGLEKGFSAMATQFFFIFFYFLNLCKIKDFRLALTCCRTGACVAGSRHS
jgi:hypothetical protein